MRDALQHQRAHHPALGASVLPKLPPCVTTEPNYFGRWVLAPKASGPDFLTVPM